MSDLTNATAPSALPLYRFATDWQAFYEKYPPPDRFLDTVYRWPADRVRVMQNERFMEVVEFAWRNPFYRNLWGKAGLQPADILSLNDITKLPIFNSDDIKTDSAGNHPPFGLFPGFSNLQSELATTPLKLQTSARHHWQASSNATSSIGMGDDALSTAGRSICSAGTGPAT